MQAFEGLRGKVEAAKVDAFLKQLGLGGCTVRAPPAPRPSPTSPTCRPRHSRSAACRGATHSVSFPPNSPRDPPHRSTTAATCLTAATSPSVARPPPERSGARRTDPPHPPASILLLARGPSLRLRAAGPWRPRGAGQAARRPLRHDPGCPHRLPPAPPAPPPAPRGRPQESEAPLAQPRCRCSHRDVRFSASASVSNPTLLTSLWERSGACQ